MKFIVQENISIIDRERIESAINKINCDILLFNHRPFDTQYPELPDHSDLFVYAAHNVTDQIFDDHKHYKGVFNRTDDIDIRQYYHRDYMWSKVIGIGSLNELMNTFNGERQIFIRPCIDDKFISGEITSLNDLYSRLSKVGDDSLYKSFFVGEVDIPEYEYRLFIVNGKVVASSLYRFNNKYYALKDSPDSIKEFAESFYKLSNLKFPCVVDVAYRKSDDKIGIIEVNSIHNSGFYDCDVDDIFKSLYDYIKGA